jgi:hypothetical protein
VINVKMDIIEMGWGGIDRRDLAQEWDQYLNVKIKTYKAIISHMGTITRRMRNGEWGAIYFVLPPIIFRMVILRSMKPGRRVASTGGERN